MSNPKVVIILSGKRKSGKDFIAELLDKEFAEKVFLRISGPIKSQYAKLHNLNFDELMGTSEYKEKVRKDMILWSEAKRREDANFFLKAEIDEKQGEQFKLWILTDARRECDLNFFQLDYVDPFKEKFNNFKDTKVIRVRIVTDEKIRESRGYTFTPGVDDVQSECGLDNVKEWDYIIQNNGTLDELKTNMKPLLDSVNQLLNPVN